MGGDQRPIVWINIKVYFISTIIPRPNLSHVSPDISVLPSRLHHRLLHHGLLHHRLLHHRLMHHWLRHCLLHHRLLHWLLILLGVSIILWLFLALLVIRSGCCLLWVVIELSAGLTRHCHFVGTLRGSSHHVLLSGIAIVIVPWCVVGCAGAVILNIICTCMGIVVVFKTLHRIFLRAQLLLFT